MADAAAGGRGGETVKINDEDAAFAYKSVGMPRAGVVQYETSSWRYGPGRSGMSICSEVEGQGSNLQVQKSECLHEGQEAFGRK
jgi:hypothetical protein